MEITLEMVERLREKAPVSYGQAKRALEYSGGNLLDALIYLEEQGAIPRQEGAYFTTRRETPPSPPQAPPASEAEEETESGKKKKKKRPDQKGKAAGRSTFLQTLRRWLIDNELEIWRRDKPITALPVLILVLLVIFAYYVVIPLLILGLFLGFRYRFSGPDLERDELNDVMGNVADTAADLGRQVMDELRAQSRHMADKAKEADREVRREESDLDREAAELERRVEEDLLGGSKKDQSPPPGSGR